VLIKIYGVQVPMKRIDEIDAKILRDLLNDGRKDFGEIAKESDVSKNRIWKHYNKMKKSGIIVGATTQINYRHLGDYAVAEVLFEIDPLERNRALELMQKMPSTNLIMSNNGTNSAYVIFRIKELKELEKVKTLIQKLCHSYKTKTEIWTGEIRNVPENLSFGLPKKYANIARPLKIKKESEIDETDMKIIDKLRENGRSPFRVIAKDIRVSTDTVARRYKKLKENGTLKTVIQISPEKIGYHGGLECRINLKSRINTALTIQELSEIPDVFDIVGTIGDWDLHVWVLIRDIEQLFRTQAKIAAVSDFGRMDIELNERYVDIYPTPGQNISRI
jgi:DNA-binding Lrp family transcriptional regulator